MKVCYDRGNESPLEELSLRNVTFVNGNLMTCKSTKQNMVSLSSTKAKYRALLHATTKLM